MFNYIKSFVFKENSLRSASWILIVTLTASKLLGVIRDHFLARNIPTDQLDVYYAAFRLPDLVLNILILGAIAAAVIPVLSRTFKESAEKAWHLVNNLLNVGALVVLVALIILYFLLPYILPYIVPSFSMVKLDETIYLARFMLFAPFFFTISYIIGSVLNVKNRFFIYSLAPIVYNLSIIIATVFWSESLGVRAPAIGVVVGAFFHMLVQVPAVINLGWRPRALIDFSDPKLRRILKLMIPRAIALGAGQIQLVAFTAFASSIVGAIAIYNLTDNIQAVPVSILGLSFATATFPRLAHLGDEDSEKFRKLLLKITGVVLFLMIPAAIGVFVLRAQIVRLILGYGFFGWTDTRQAADTLAFFSVGIIAQGVIPLLARAFYSLENTRYPMWAAIIAVAIGITSGYFGLQSLGVAGLALGFTIASWSQLFILLAGLESQIKLKLTQKFWLNVGKIIILSAIMAVIMQLVKLGYAAVFDIDKVYNLLLQTVIAIALGVGVYLGGAKLFNVQEAKK